ncbi:MAG: FecR family protein [Lachnospiraceae bacterium]|nr:FecR family protein [Lachnospiraceae bacterium]
MNKKKIFIIAGILVCAAVAAVLIILTRNRAEAYRIIKVYEKEGEAKVNRDPIGDIEVYLNMLLESGDKVSVGDGILTLQLDDDKFVYAEANTDFELIAEGTKKNSKTTINLLEGSIANDIQNKLSKESYYEINTPNSTMAVRGTVYYVGTYVGEDGKRYTKISVFDGAVDADLVFSDGTRADNTKLVQQGKEILIYTDDDEEITDYVFDDVRDIVYEELPLKVLESLEKIEENNESRIELPEEVHALIEEMKEEAKGPFTVTFMYGNNVFATQTIELGGKATIPTFQPEPTGDWDFDFSTLITEDTEIHWK